MPIGFYVYNVGFSDYVGCFGEMIEHHFPAQQIPANVDPDRFGGMEDIVEKIHRRSVK